MKISRLSTLFVATGALALVADRDASGFSAGQPIDGTGKGAPISGEFTRRHVVRDQED
jgi:hypothetical protein